MCGGRLYTWKTPVVGVAATGPETNRLVRGDHKKAVVAFCGRTSSMLLPIPLANLALSFLSSLFPEHVDQHPHVRLRPLSPNNVLNFHLRHFHAATSSAHVYFA